MSIVSKSCCIHCRDYYRCLTTDNMYFLALRRGKRRGTVIVIARRCLEELSGVWEYLGPHMTTKKRLAEDKATLLAWINKETGSDFTRVCID